MVISIVGESSTPVDPEDRLLLERAAWIAGFREQRAFVLHGIEEGQSDEARHLTVERAAQALFGNRGSTVPFEEYVELNGCARALDDKLQEMLAVLSGQKPSGKTKVRIPDNPLGWSTDQLTSVVCAEERRFLFVGGMLEIIHRLRDLKHAMTLKVRDQLLDQLANSTASLRNTIEQLNTFDLVEVNTSAAQRRRVEALLTQADKAREFYQQILSPADSDLSATLAARGGLLVRRQYIECAFDLALQLYGVETLAFEELLWNLKGIDDPDIVPEDERPTQENLASFMDDCRTRVMERVLRRAKDEKWALLPVLQLFYIPRSRFGRRNVTRRSSPSDQLQYHVLHDR